MDIEGVQIRTWLTQNWKNFNAASSSPSLPSCPRRKSTVDLSVHSRVNRISVAMSLFIVTVVASTKEISSKVLTCSYIASTKVLERSGAF